MNKEIKEKWVKALRSGDYRQGDGYLKYVEEDGTVKHCCLGVLCEIALAEGVNLEIRPLDLDTYDGNAIVFDSEWELTPDAVVEWAGLGEQNPTIRKGPDTLSDLATENDNGKSFAEIADLIEEQL